MTLKIGMMQGRLSPPHSGKIQSFPKTSWREEFSKAQSCGLNLIEWIFEADDWKQNPLATADGINEIRNLTKQTGVSVDTICADYFMDLPLVQVSETQRLERIEMLRFVIEKAHSLGARFIGIPFVDASALHSKEEIEIAAESLRTCFPLIEKTGVNFALETSLSPEMFRFFLDRVKHPQVGVNYDIGNSASLGFDPEEEIDAYGSCIYTVHIKDRLLAGTTVALGTGHADFEKTFKSLAQAKFNGPFIFQAARQGDEIENTKRNLKFIKPFLKYFELT